MEANVEGQEERPELPKVVSPLQQFLIPALSPKLAEISQVSPSKMARDPHGEPFE